MEDDLVDIDINNVEDTRETIPDGVYLCRIKSVEKKHKAGSEYPYLDVRLTPDGHERKTLFHNLSYHPNALWNMKAFVTRAGVEWGKNGFHYRDLIGRRIGVTVSIEPSRDDPNEKRNVISPPYHKAN